MGTIAQVGTISAYPSLSKWIWTYIGTTVDTIAQVGTISAYLSLSKNGFGPTFAKLTFCKMELDQFWAMWATSEVDFGPKLHKVGIIECGFGPKLGKVEIIGRLN